MYPRRESTKAVPYWSWPPESTGGNDFLMAVGDADMDIPMFESVDYIFAVGNASEGAKNVAGYVLEGKYEQGIGEIYRLIDGMRP